MVLGSKKSHFVSSDIPKSLSPYFTDSFKSYLEGKTDYAGYSGVYVPSRLRLDDGEKRTAEQLNSFFKSVEFVRK